MASSGALGNVNGGTVHTDTDLDRTLHSVVGQRVRGGSLVSVKPSSLLPAWDTPGQVHGSQVATSPRNVTISTFGFRFIPKSITLTHPVHQGKC